MFSGKCHECGIQYYGVILLDNEHRTCAKCGGTIILNDRIEEQGMKNGEPEDNNVKATDIANK